MTIDSLVLVLIVTGALLLLPLIMHKPDRETELAIGMLPGAFGPLQHLAVLLLASGAFLLALTSSDRNAGVALATLPPASEETQTPGPPPWVPPASPADHVPVPLAEAPPAPAAAAPAPAAGLPAESGAPAAEPAPEPVEAPKESEGPSPATNGPAEPAPEPRPEHDEARLTLVPVFFGTDRMPLEAEARLAFGAGRARRLALGRALVSVPAAHAGTGVERPWALTLPFTGIILYEQAEDAARHFSVREISVLSREALILAVKERLGASAAFEGQALIFVHGFNTSFDNALYRTAQIAHDLEFDGASFLYSWPSRGGVSSYTYDRDSAAQSQPYLREFAQMVVEESGASSVSVIAHSLGNGLLLGALKELKALSPDVGINQIILAAPDMDRDSFALVARELREIAKGMTLYVAGNDRALGVSRNFHGGAPRAGDVAETGPVVVDGVETVDVTAISTDALALNQATYADRKALLGHVASLLRTGDRPQTRIPELERVPGPMGEYWRYP